MKRILAAIMLAALCLLLAGCAPDRALPENGQPGYASCGVGLFTDGQRVYLMQRKATLREWSSAFTVYEVTGGDMRRIVSGRDANDAAVLDGALYIASHTANWLKPMQDSAELDGYSAADGRSTLHVSARDESNVNPDFYTFHMAGERVIRQRNVYTVKEGYWQEFAFVDASGNAGEPFYTLPYSGSTVTDTYIVSAEYKGDAIHLFDLDRMEACTLPVIWGRDPFGDPLLPQGVLLEGVLYYPAADGVRACELVDGRDSLLVPVTAPEYFYVTGGRLYTAADDGRLTACDLSTGAILSTPVVLTKADRYVIAGDRVYILQGEKGCRIETLLEAE